MIRGCECRASWPSVRRQPLPLSDLVLLRLATGIKVMASFFRATRRKAPTKAKTHGCPRNTIKNRSSLPACLSQRFWSRVVAHESHINLSFSLHLEAYPLAISWNCLCNETSQSTATSIPAAHAERKPLSPSWLKSNPLGHHLFIV